MTNIKRGSDYSLEEQLEYLITKRNELEDIGKIMTLKKTNRIIELKKLIKSPRQDETDTQTQ